MLSDEDINQAIANYMNNTGDGLFIEPFDKKYLTPVGYDLRVGKEGFSWKSKRLIDIEKEGKIDIEANDIVVIRTLERVELSKKVSATIHSIVSKVITKGLSNISTTVDPGYAGTLLISFCNYRDSATELRFGETLCTVCFYEVDLVSKTNRGTPSDRDDLWDQLLEKAKLETDRLEREERQQKEEREKAISSRNKLLVMVGFVVSISVFMIYFKYPQLAVFIVSFLTFLVPILYENFFKNNI